MNYCYAASSETNFFRSTLSWLLSCSVISRPNISRSYLNSLLVISCAKLLRREAGSSSFITNSCMCISTSSNRSNSRQSYSTIEKTVSATRSNTLTPLRKKRSQTTNTVSNGILFTKICTSHGKVNKSVLKPISSKWMVSSGCLYCIKLSNTFWSTSTPKKPAK